MEEKLNSKPCSYSLPFGKMSATVRRNTEYFMKGSQLNKQQTDLAVVPGNQTLNHWSSLSCEGETTLYDSNLDHLNTQSTQEFIITEAENRLQKRHSEPLPHPTKLRKKKKPRASTLKWAERKNGNIEYHLSQLKSKQMARMSRSQLPQKLNENKEFHYSQYQNSESIFLTNDTI